MGLHNSMEKIQEAAEGARLCCQPLFADPQSHNVMLTSSFESCNFEVTICQLFKYQCIPDL